jgi:hypothetical protein
MSVILKNNFLLNARCITFKDGNGISWGININTNEITAAYSGSGSSGSANPSATIGLSAVNGTAPTFMTSDSAPPLSQAIVPTWSGLHTFGAGLTISAGSFTLNGHTLTLSANASVGGTNTGDQTAANPTASVGLSAVNGVSASFMRADGAPALSQAISPTWTGNHIFNPTSGTPLLVELSGTALFKVLGTTTPTVQGYGPTAAGLVDMTPDTGSFTITLVGCTTSPTGTAFWSKQGNHVTLMLPTLTGTSNSTGLSVTGLPAEIQPARTHNCSVPFLEDAGATTGGAAQVNAASGTIVFFKGANTSTASFTNSATTKGIAAANTFTYFLN